MMVDPTHQSNSSPVDAELSAHKRTVRDHFDKVAARRDYWITRNRYFYETDRRYMQFLVPPGKRVLELGCGTGSLLAALAPSHGVGIDLSPAMIEIARRNHPAIEFRIADVEDEKYLEGLEGPFDYIILSDSVGCFEDCQRVFSHLHGLCDGGTRVIVAYYTHLWEPVLAVAGWLGSRMPQIDQNWLAAEDVAGLLNLADFDVIKRDWRQLMPRRLLGLGTFLNRYVGTLPMIRHFCLRHYVIARSARHLGRGDPSASVVIPCRNEKGNIESAVERMPRFCDDLEIIFVEGHSTDGTYEECLRVQKAYPGLDIKVLRQDGKGKADAVRKGFGEARGEVLMILDADLTMPPEELPKFYDALATGKGEFINGTRLVYAYEKGAMQFLNFLANRGFAKVFSWLLNQRVTDTLCGTKVLSRTNYRCIMENRDFLGDDDPFGDFDLILGAAKLNLKMVEVPVRYGARSYGTTNISRFRHGWYLLRVAFSAYRKMKAL